MPDYGNALDFGSGGKVQIEFADPWDGDESDQAWGLGVWLRRVSWSGATNARLLNMNDQGDNDAGDIWIDGSDRLGVRFYTSEGSSQSTAYLSAVATAALSGSTWYCLGVSFAASGVISVYMGTESTSMTQWTYDAQADVGTGWYSFANFGGVRWVYGRRRTGAHNWTASAGDGADELTMYGSAPTSSEWEEWRTTGAITGKSKLLYIPSANPPVDAGSIGATLTPTATVALMTGPNVGGGATTAPPPVYSRRRRALLIR